MQYIKSNLNNKKIIILFLLAVLIVSVPSVFAWHYKQSFFYNNWDIYGGSSSNRYVSKGYLSESYLSESYNYDSSMYYKSKGFSDYQKSEYSYYYDTKSKKPKIVSKKVSIKEVVAHFEGNQGPWEHVSNGDAKAPTLALSGLKKGQTVKVLDVTGSYSHRIYHNKDQLPSSCRKDTYGTFTDENKKTIARFPLTRDTFGSGSSFDKGIKVSQGATRLYIHILESGSNNYFDNSGNRDNRLPCEVELKTFRVPQCSDGIDNDKDGKIDEDDLGCVNRFDDDEREHDPECRYV